MVKVIAAFTGGIVVALGCAMIYVKERQPASQSALVQTAPPPSEPAALPDADRAAAPPIAEPPADAQAPSTPAPAAKRPLANGALKSSVGHRYRRNNQAAGSAGQPDQPPVLVAQNTSASQPAVNPAQNPYTAAPPAAPSPAPEAPSAPPPPPVRQPRTVTIPAGTTLSIRLGEKLSTDQNYTGDAFRATLESPLIMNGAVIAERGSKVLGKVVNAEKAGRVKGVSDLQLALTEINTTDGQRVEVQTASLDTQGSTEKKKDAAKVGGGAAIGAIIGAIAGGGKGAGIGAGVGGAAGAGDVLLTRGKPVVLPTESKLNFQLSAPLSITERLNN